MSKRQIIMLLGVLIIFIALFSGLPTVWNTCMYVIIGLIIIAVAYTTSKPAQDQLRKAFGSAPFVDAKKTVSTSKSTESVQAVVSTPAPIVPPLTVTDVTEQK